MASGTAALTIPTDTEKVIRDVRNAVNAREQAQAEQAKLTKDVVSATEELKQQLMSLATQGATLDTVYSQCTQWASNKARPLEDKKQALMLYAEASNLRVVEFKHTHPCELLTVLEEKVKELDRKHELEAKEAKEIAARIGVIKEEIEDLKTEGAKGSRRSAARAAAK